MSSLPAVTVLRAARAVAVLALLGALPRTAAPQDPPGGPGTVTRVVDPSDEGTSIDTTIPFATSGGVVDLTLQSGEATVSGWSRAEARIHVSSDESPVRFEHGPNRILLDTPHGYRHHDDGDVRYDITVPAGTRVLMHSTSGDLRSSGTHGEIEARSVSGDVEVEDAARSATLESVSGNVKARAIDGDVRTRSVSGDVDLDRVHGDITLSSVSGHGYVTNARSRVARMETVSGDLEYAGAIDPTGTYDFRAHSGDVRLEVPGDIGATLAVDTFNGDIKTDFPLTVKFPESGDDRGPARHHIDTTIGSGGAHITISTFSGDVELRRSGPHSTTN